MKRLTKFRNIIGNSPEAKIIELLLEGRELEYTHNDIIRGARVSRQRGYKILRDFSEKGILIKTVKAKQIQLHKLNIKDYRVKKLKELFDYLIK